MNKTDHPAIKEATPNGFSVRYKVHFATGPQGRKKIKKGIAPPTDTTPGIPRISQLMALAIRFDRLLSEGTVKDYADLARLGKVSRARVTQIMGLLQLAPDIQEGLLHLPKTISGRDPIREKMVRPVTMVLDWGTQRREWNSRLQ